MKKILVAVMLVAALSMAAMAADVHAVANKQGDASFHGTQGWGNPPAAAAKLIFYGGDVNPSDPNANGFANGNSILVPNTQTYGAVTAPKGSRVVALGILFNNVPTCSEAACTGTNFDPATGTYDIRVGLTEGSGGTDVTSGSGPQLATKTGRILGFFGASLPEYSTSVAFTKPLTPAGGTTYWLNESPQCTNQNDSNCQVSQWFATNTTQQTNGINATLQPSFQAFFNSAFFGFNYDNACDLVGGQSPLCQWQSFGVYGQ